MISTGFIAAAFVLGELFLAPRQHGSVHFAPHSRSVSCGNGLLTPTGSAVLP